MEYKDILVVIPHSGILIPYEISKDRISADFPRLMRNVDWYTNWLYEFRDILNNTSLTFPYCSLILEANRDPEDINSSVPVKDSSGEPVYRSGFEPDFTLRQQLAQKYLVKFHQNITNEISFGKTFMLDAHSTVTDRGVADNEIELMNYQISQINGEKIKFCPDLFIEIYAEELNKRLPGISISINQSEYHYVYGHVCGQHSLNAMTRVGSRVPAILQETNQKLYLNPDKTPNFAAIDALRRAFAEALFEMSKTVVNIRGEDY